MLRDLLLTGNASGGAVVIDPKGEALRYVGKLGLRPFGLVDAPSRYDVMWLDPFNVMDAGTWSFNPLSHLGADNPNASADAKLLAQGLVIQSSAKEPHWDEVARNFWAALLLYVAQHPSVREPRDLVTARRWLRLPWKQENAAGESLLRICAGMADWENGPEAAIAGANGALELTEGPLQSFLMSARRDSHFLDDAPIQNVMRPSRQEISAKEAALERKMVFVVIPDAYAESHKGWLRLVVSSFAFYFRLYQHARKTWANRRHIFIDEWPNLQRLEAAQQGVTVTRGLGCMWHLYCQDFARPKDLYGSAWEGFFASSVVQAFGINDNTTLEYLSRRMGNTTVETVQEAEDRFRKRNFGEAGRPLMTPDEIARLCGRNSNQQLIIHTGCDPLFCSRYAVYWWKDYQRANPGPGQETFTLKEALEASRAQNPSAADLKRFAWWRPD